MFTTRLDLFVSVGVLLSSTIAVPRCHSQTLEWTRQLNFASHDVSADGLGNVYISGFTNGNTADDVDAALAEYDELGNLQWTRTLSTNVEDWSWGVSADGLGNVYQSGHTGGIAGSSDAYVAKYDAAGNRQWIRLLGTDANESSHGVFADRLGNVLISGYTIGNLNGPNAGGLDVFVAKYDALGIRQWTRQFGTSTEENGWRVSGDLQGNAYVTGSTSGSLGGTNAGSLDAFVTKYDASGNLQWTRQFGTSEIDRGRGVSADNQGNVFVSGWINGSEDGNENAFVAKYDSAGVLKWTQQFGNSGTYSADLTADGHGNVYVLGYASSGLDGGSGEAGGFIRKYGSAGTVLWTLQSASMIAGYRSRISTDGQGNIYFQGGGSLGKVSEQVPEPSAASFWLGGLTLAAVCRRRRTTPDTFR